MKWVGQSPKIVEDEEEDEFQLPFGGLLKKAASGVLAKFRCSRTKGTLRA